MMQTDQTSAHIRWATLGGFGAILLWSTTVAVVRSLCERQGALPAAAAVYGVGALLAAAEFVWRPGHFRAVRQLPLRYLIGCGALFTVYTVVLFLAVSMAHTREQVLVVALLNYLWPALTVLLSVVLLRQRAAWWLAVGTPLAMAGMALVMTQGAGVSWAALGRIARDNPPAYALGLVAAVSWTLYSVLTRRWAGTARLGGVGLFLPGTAFVLAGLSLLAPSRGGWSLPAAAEAAFLGCCTYVAYKLWDQAMRRGRMALVAMGAYLTPLLSTLVSCVYLRVSPSPSLWVGCALLVGGSLLSARSVSAVRPGPHEPSAVRS